MFRWFQALMPREDRFFELYNRHAQTLVQGASALRALLTGGPGIAASAQQIFAFEAQADDVAREVLLLVRRTFITPFDRSDINDLINTLDWRFRKDGTEELLKDYADLLRFTEQSSWVRGKRVRIEENGSKIEGSTEGLDERGFLQVRTIQGLQTILSGTVRAL